MALTQNTVRNFNNIQTSGGTKTSHSITILAADGKGVIGMIQNWQPSRSRPVQRIFELNSNTSGQGVDLVPGTVDTDTLSVTRTALWAGDLFNSITNGNAGADGQSGNGAASGNFAKAVDWLQQRNPFEVSEVWDEPAGGGIAKDYTQPTLIEEARLGLTGKGNRVGGPKIIKYFGCWFSEINPDAYVAQGDKAVVENSTIEVLGRSYS